MEPAKKLDHWLKTQENRETAEAIETLLGEIEAKAELLVICADADYAEEAKEHEAFVVRAANTIRDLVQR